MAVVVDRANLSNLGEQRAIRLHLGGNRSRHEQQGGNAPSHFHRSLSQTRVMPFPAPGRSRAEPVGAHLSWTEDLNDGQAWRGVRIRNPFAGKRPPLARASQG